MPAYITEKKSTPTVIQWSIPDFRGLAKFRGFPHGERIVFHAGNCGAGPLEWELSLQLRTHNLLPCFASKYKAITPSSRSDRILLHVCLKPRPKPGDAEHKSIYVNSAVQSSFMGKDGKVVSTSKEYSSSWGSSSSSSASNYVFEFNVFGLKDAQVGTDKEQSVFWDLGGSRQIPYREGLRRMSKQADTLFIEVALEVVELEAKKDPEGEGQQ